MQEADEGFCFAIGATAGDTALAQGADTVVIVSNLRLRLADHLPKSVSLAASSPFTSSSGG